MGSLGVLAFSGTLPATRIAVTAFGPEVITAVRIEIATVLGLLTLVLTRQWRLPARKHWPGILWTGFGLAVGYPLFVALALEHVPAAHGAVVIGIAPAVTALIAVVRANERPPLIFWMACLIGIGAVLVFAVRQGRGSLRLADGWLIVAMLSVGIAYVEGGRISRELGGMATLCWAMIALAPVVAVRLASPCGAMTGRCQFHWRPGSACGTRAWSACFWDPPPGTGGWRQAESLVLAS